MDIDQLTVQERGGGHHCIVETLKFLQSDKVHQCMVLYNTDSKSGFETEGGLCGKTLCRGHEVTGTPTAQSERAGTSINKITQVISEASIISDGGAGYKIVQVSARRIHANLSANIY
jgi:hypothetical protein